MAGRRSHWGLSLFWLLNAACSLTQSLDGYEGTPEARDAGDAATDAPQTCLSGTKSCSGVCVEISDPAYGCGAAGCSPCANAGHTVSACSAGGCLPTGCEANFADCDADPLNGCETALGTETDCSSCAEVCANAGDNVQCNAETLRCEIGSCPSGTGDCNSEVADGCESALDGSPDCGACGVLCPPNFSCTTGAKRICACSDAASCNSGTAGSCVQGLCVCGTAVCAAGERCLATGSCG